MLFKMIGMGTLAFVMSKGTGIGEQQMAYFTNLAKNVLTQHEVNSISHLIYTGHIIGNDYILPDKSDDEWAQYIKTEMRSNVPSRDTSKDMWNTRYLVRTASGLPGMRGDGYVVRSAGPDMKYENEDDVACLTSYR